MKNSPTPWKLNNNSWCSGISITDADGKEVLKARPRISETGKDITYNNATLAANAPRMLDAILKARECFNGQHNLLSTATDNERKAVISNFNCWWNGHILQILKELEENRPNQEER